MVITLGSLLWNWLWAPSVMEVVWFFRLNCSLAWIYETLTVLHSHKLSSPISRLVLHLGHAKESEKVSRQPKPYRRSHGTCLSLPAWGHLPWWRLQSLWGCLQKGAQLLQLSDPLDVEEDCYTQWSSTTLSVGQWHGALTNITSVRNLLIPSTILGPVHRAALLPLHLGCLYSSKGLQDHRVLLLGWLVLSQSSGMIHCFLWDEQRIPPWKLALSPLFPSQHTILANFSLFMVCGKPWLKALLISEQLASICLAVFSVQFGILENKQILFGLKKKKKNELCKICSELCIHLWFNCRRTNQIFCWEVVLVCICYLSLCSSTANYIY